MNHKAKKKKVLRRSSMMPAPTLQDRPMTIKAQKRRAKGSLRVLLKMSYKERLMYMTNHTVFTLIDAFLSFWVLLVPPFKDMFIPVEGDTFLLVCTIIIFIFFCVEVVILAYAQEEYFLSTYFWLDLIATASLVVDMIPRDPSEATRQLSAVANFNDSQMIDRFAQLLGRLGRTVRLLRLFRQLRVIKVLMRGFSDNEKAEEACVAEALVEQVSDRMSRRVVVIILVSVISIMLLQYPEIDQSREESTRMIHAAGENGTSTFTFQDTVNKLLTLRKGGQGAQRLLYLSVHGVVFKEWPALPDVQKNQLRANQWEELILNHRTADTLRSTIAAFDLRAEVHSQAEYDVGIIVAVTAILFFFAVLLSWDSVQLIREPFRKMIRAESLSKALLSVFKVTAHEDDIHIVSQTVVDASNQLLGCETVNLYFVEPISKQMICRHSCSANIDDKAERRSWGGSIINTIGSMRRRSKGPKKSAVTRKKSMAQFSFAMNLSDERYISVYVANHGTSIIKNNRVPCYNGKEYMCRNVLVTPVLDTTNKVVAVVEAVNKRHGEFTEADNDAMTAFSEQMSAVISRKALDAVYSSILSHDSTLDDTARSLLKQYSVATSSSSTSSSHLVDEKGRVEYTKNGSSTTEGEKQKIIDVRHDRMNSMADDLERVQGNKQLSETLSQRTHHLSEAQSTISKMVDWNTNLFDCPIHELQFSVVALMMDLNLLSEFRISRNYMVNFVEKASLGYNDIPYHNFYHGFNVFQVCTIMLRDTNLNDFLERHDMLALLVGAICHDIGHQGVNNTFHKLMYQNDPKIQTLALKYNDVSVLENMHSSKAFEITTEEGCNIFENIQQNIHYEIRRMMIKGILATDMEHHMEHVKKLQSKTDFNIEDRNDRTFLIEICMHTSDLSNPTQPWKNCKRWALAVAHEFIEQVELEKKYHLPISSHMDLNGELTEFNPEVAKLNISFTEYLVKGLVVSFCDFFPSWNPRMEEMEKNLVIWKDLQQKGNEKIQIELETKST